VEVDRDTDAAGHRDTVLRGRVEAPLPRGLDRGTVEVTVAAGALDLHVEHVPLGVDADDQDHGAFDTRTQRAGRITGRVLRTRGRIHRAQRRGRRGRR